MSSAQQSTNYAACAFNPTAYSAMYPDLSAQFGTNAADLQNHYLTWGINNRTPCGQTNPLCVFNPQTYLQANPDLQATYGNNPNGLINQYKTQGIKQGRNVCPTAPIPSFQACAFNPTAYSAMYPDLAAKYGTNAADLQSHYLTWGITDRSPCGQTNPSCLFNPQTYLAANPDLQATYGNNPTGLLNQYKTQGIKQGRNVCPAVPAPSAGTSSAPTPAPTPAPAPAPTPAPAPAPAPSAGTSSAPAPAPTPSSIPAPSVAPIPVTTSTPSTILDWDQALQQANALQQQDLINGEIFQIVTDPIKNQCIAVNNTIGNADGINTTALPLTTTTCNANDLKQNFQYIPDPTNKGGNQIKNLYNNTCMNVFDGGNMSSLNDGSPIVMWECGQNPQYNNRFSTNADNTQPTPITTYADKCIDTTGQNGSVVQNSCVFGKQGQYFQYQRINPTKQTPESIILNGQVNTLNQETSGMINNSANVPSINNTALTQQYVEQQLQTAKNNQTSLMDVAKKSMNTLLKTKKKMYPVAGKTKLASSSPQFVHEGFSGVGSSNPYRFSKTNEINLTDTIQTINNKILLMMKQINRKNIIISVISLLLLSLIYISILLLLYKKNALSKTTTLIFFVLLLMYLSYRFYKIFYDPAVALNTLAVDANEIRERVCQDL